MKKIMMLTMVMAVAAATGCCQGLPRMSWFRGDACSDCGTYETTPNYSGYNTYDTGVAIPNLPALPGPAEPTQ